MLQTECRLAYSLTLADLVIGEKREKGKRGRGKEKIGNEV